MRVQVRVQATPDYKERTIFVRPQSVALIEPLDPRNFDSTEPKSRLVVEGQYEYVALEEAKTLNDRLERERVEWDERERTRQAVKPFGNPKPVAGVPTKAAPPGPPDPPPAPPGRKVG